MQKKKPLAANSMAALIRKSATESFKKEKSALEEEEKFWKEAAGPQSRAAKKREAETLKKAEAAARKAERKKLAEREQREPEKIAWWRFEKKPTEAELAERKLMARWREMRIADEAEHDRIMSGDVRTVDDVIKRMSFLPPEWRPKANELRRCYRRRPPTPPKRETLKQEFRYQVLEY